MTDGKEYLVGFDNGDIADGQYILEINLSWAKTTDSGVTIAQFKK